VLRSCRRWFQSRSIRRISTGIRRAYPKECHACQPSTVNLGTSVSNIAEYFRARCARLRRNAKPNAKLPVMGALPARW
jgi:hypothetical protein